MLNVQKYLIEKTEQGLSKLDALAALKDEFAIGVRLYEQDRLALLDYNQIDSPKAHPIVIECRSLIINIDTFGVVSRKFDRFFNFGECPDLYTDFSFENAVVFEKADGSLCGIYFNPATGVWEVSTRGMAKAEGEHIMGGTFRNRILAAAGFADEGAFQQFATTTLHKAVTYVFEFCSPENRIVTKYDTDHLVLLSVNDGVQEFNIDHVDVIAQSLAACGLNVRRPKVFDKQTSLAEMVEVANRLTDLAEGFVVYDPTSHKRVKIKSQTYLVAHRLRGNEMVPTRKNLLELVLEGEVDEMLAYFPEYARYIDPVVAEVKQFELDLARVYNEHKHIESQKEFALAIAHFRGKSFLFTARATGVNDPARVFHQTPLIQKVKLFL